jgi:twitching motility protein PilI
MAIVLGEVKTMENPVTIDADITVPLTELPMSPTQALTTGFDVVANGAIELPRQSNNKSASVSALVSGESRQGFHIGGLHMMIRYEDASELSEMPVINKLPNTPDWFCGIANMHGKLIPVFDLALHIGAAYRPESRRMLLVLSRGLDATGIMIDGLPERLHIGKESIAEDTPLSSALADIVSGTYWLAGQSWMALDVGALLESLEQELSSAS